MGLKLIETGKVHEAGKADGWGAQEWERATMGREQCIEVHVSIVPTPAKHAVDISEIFG